MLPRALRPAVAWFSRTKLFRTVGPSVMPGFEKALTVATGGRVISSGLIVPSLELHTTGARSGELRSVKLMCCPTRGGWYVTGSNFARERHPGWTANLLAHPDAAVTINLVTVPVRASLVPDDRREDVWTELEANWPGYRGYERTAQRELRIFKLEPALDREVV
ncbi:nitroreductase/quinone reductase family protein [Schumannella luteola]|uniref:Deazaflavin-dependent oxidoreductase (Nitroreductase family) n=1 Tax=Schumannella luteola TaxID=472059 RepID=A0A852YD78_9MICO|nr:nitroreductase family deazaflavin-dependent oxidoreductase [Schumannella luteola]NYG99234.1 deazaflavin-dependent oxidoreductase (nitroreductase family) [Schumannella luteola]TPX05618.1 nitroreductase family deazaflavin-dependent oxidoreductase [Schumannella luteola]